MRGRVKNDHFDPNDLSNDLSVCVSYYDNAAKDLFIVSLVLQYRDRA